MENGDGLNDDRRFEFGLFLLMCAAPDPLFHGVKSHVAVHSVNERLIPDFRL